MGMYRACCPHTIRNTWITSYRFIYREFFLKLFHLSLHQKNLAGFFFVIYQMCISYLTSSDVMTYVIITSENSGLNYLWQKFDVHCITTFPDFWEGDATKHFSVKKGVFSEKGGGNSVNLGFGKDFYRKGNSVKRFGRFSEPPDSGK